MRKIYNIRLLKPLGYISIQYAEKLPAGKWGCLSKKEDLERTMFNEETINILEVLVEREQLQNNWNKLKAWLKKEHREDAIKINLSWKTATGKILNKIKEIEGSDKQCVNVK